MRRRSNLVMLNPTCLDVIDRYRPWIESLNVRLIAEDRFRSLQDGDVAGILDEADGLILPACLRGLPGPQHMANFPKLKVLSIAASGYEWLDIDGATRNGI